MSLAENIRRTGVLPGELAVCWLGQAGFLLKDCQGKVLVIDPYLSNCGEQMRGFKRLSPILLAPEELTPDYYLITHLHFDHFDYETVPKILERGTSPLFLGPSSCREKLKWISSANPLMGQFSKIFRFMLSPCVLEVVTYAFFMLRHRRRRCQRLLPAGLPFSLTGTGVP